MIPWVHSGRLRASSVSSIRSTNVPPRRLASAQLYSAVRAPPTWKNPVGDGANRNRGPLLMVGPPYRPHRFRLGGTAPAVECASARSVGRWVIRARLRKLAQGDRQGGEVVGIGPADVGEHRHRPADDALVGRRPLAGASDVERVVGQVGERAHQVVAQRRTGLGLPTIVARQHADRIPQPSEVERVEHLPVRGRSFVDGQVLTAGQVDDVERRCASAATPRTAGRPYSGHAGGQPGRFAGEQLVARSCRAGAIRAWSTAR